ncbi:SGNH/GDSL hydrolase family protein [Marihabitans asiaticum]|uniref:Lysophospholipase L1-like esterase n=1 Tax=Marihabitans asiaticum TaxID=415218 RepID=A0A560WI20_9MICO|nr:SGNH/GDSL hydrolase family protein [Marihabitans asiaticum]TWD17055.1 lysophospholipase L1-like esterase [Marihabitans asiaticum]
MSHAPPRLWTSYVAVGDSFSEGMSEPDPRQADRYLGWADRLADALARRLESEGGQAPFRYANLAVRGRKLDDVVGRQLDEALPMGADLVSIVGGGNDILRPNVDLEALADRIEGAVERARATGADVLLATPTDPAKAGLLASLRPRHAVHTANLFSIAQRHGAHVLNLWSMRSLQDWRMWSEDRIHLSPEGHRRVALAALDALGLDTDRTDWTTPLEPEPLRPRVERLGTHARWARTHAGPWVHRRMTGRSSGDSITAKRPELSPLAPGELPFAHA